MPRIAMLIEYSGAEFCGSQFQSGKRTVQAELEKALSTLARSPVPTIFAGRTDSGVHARGQVVHFDWPFEEPDLWRLCWGINGILPDDVSINKMQLVANTFHARYKAIERRYVYSILNRPQRSALLSCTHYFVPHALDLKGMDAAIAALHGEHDFNSFKSSNSNRSSTICHVRHAEMLNLGEGVLQFYIAANRFVYNMVRIIVGTLLEIGLGKRQPESLAIALSGKNRDLAGPTAPPWGLCLDSVQYPDVYKLFASSLQAGMIQEKAEI